MYKETEDRRKEIGKTGATKEDKTQEKEGAQEDRSEQTVRQE